MNFTQLSNIHDMKMKMLFYNTDTDIILKNIICIKDKQDGDVNYSKITFKHTFYLDDEKISKRCTYRVVYTCPRCDKKCTIRLATLGNKLRRGYKGCKYCFHDERINNNIADVTEIVKSEYFKKELTMLEFERIKHCIKLIQNKYPIDHYIYKPIIQYGNEFKSMLYDPEQNVYEEIVDLTMICEKCQGQFAVKYLHLIKNVHHIFCNECKRIKSLKFGTMDNVVYKTKLEMKFIQLCVKVGIQIVNGSDGNLYIPKLNKTVYIVHKKFKKMNIPNAIYSDEMTKQLKNEL